MIKYLTNLTLSVFIAISFLVQACGQDVDELKAIIHKETGIVINKCHVLNQGNDSAPGDFTDYFTLQLDSLNFVSVVTQIEAHESYLDTLIQFPEFHNLFATQNQENTQLKRWTKAPFGYRYMHELHDRGIVFIVCQVNTESQTFSYRYVQD